MIKIELTKIELPDGTVLKIPNTGSGWELINSVTLEEPTKTVALGGNLDEYGIVYFKVSIPAVDEVYYSAISLSQTSAFNWTQNVNQSSTPAEQPYYFRGIYYSEENKAFCEVGKASQYELNARISNAQSSLSIPFIPKYLVVTTNTENINLPVNTHAEIWGIKRS